MLSISSADGSPLKIIGYIRSHLTLEGITLPVEAFVVPPLGPEKASLDKSIMGAFGAVLDWHTEALSYETSQAKNKLTPRYGRPSQGDTDAAQCSVVRLTRCVTRVPVFSSRNYVYHHYTKWRSK